MPNIKKKDADKIYFAGLFMSNWLYNMSQNPEFSKYSESMRDMVKEWDEIKSKLRK